MTTTQETEAPVRVAAHNAVTKRLGNWTTARRFEVRANRGFAVLDLRSPEIPDGEIEVHVDLDHAVLKLLVGQAAAVDDWNLRRTGRGKVKDYESGSATGARHIRLTGELRHAEIRVQRGGIAMLSAMFSRAYWEDLRRVHRDGGYPTVDDPTRTH